MRQQDSVWFPIVTAATSARAVELAALLPPSTSYDFPCLTDALPSRALGNLIAVSRALSRTIPGVPQPPAPILASPIDDYAALDAPLSGDDVSGARRRSDGKQLETLPDADDRCIAVVDSEHMVHREEVFPKASDATEAPAPALASVDEQPSATELAAATALCQWALQSPHTPLPAEQLSIVLSSASPGSVLRAIFPESMSSETVAVLLAAVVPSCGARLAGTLGDTVLLPLLSRLATPAPRDLMKAIVLFAEEHWRAAVPLFAVVRTRGSETLTGPAAEVFVRMAGVLTVQGAKEALVLCCDGEWGDEAVPVFEALLSICKGESGVAGPLVSSFERNVGGMARSIRFGKLLFLCVKDLPEIRAEHGPIMRNVASKSSAFLAKRAISLLDK